MTRGLKGFAASERRRGGRLDTLRDVTHGDGRRRTTCAHIAHRQRERKTLRDVAAAHRYAAFFERCGVSGVRWNGMERYENVSDYASKTAMEQVGIRRWKTYNDEDNGWWRFVATDGDTILGKKRSR